MIEIFDDSEIRENRAIAKESQMPQYWIDTGNQEQDSKAYSSRFDAWVAANTTERKPCPYCAAAKKGGAHGDIDHADSGLIHKVRVTSIEEIKNKSCLSTWHLDAACGAVFDEIVDSSD